MTFLVSLFVTSRNLFFGVFLPRKSIIILRKINTNFWQVSLKGVLLSVRVLEYFGKTFKRTCEKVESLKKLYYSWASSQVAYKVSSKTFFYLFTEACLCHRWSTYFVIVFIFEKSISSRFYSSWDGKRKKNKSQFLDYICRLIWSTYLNYIII